MAREGPVKKTKQVGDCCSGKRVIDLSIARMMAPGSAYLYETVDLTKIRVFVGQSRKSFHAKVAIGRGRAILQCLKWSWEEAERQQPGMFLLMCFCCLILIL